MVTKREAIARMLAAKARPELARLYNQNMEVQVNVAQDDGERVDGEYNGKKWLGFTNNLGQTWKPIRIPFNAKSEPTFTDSEIKWDLAAHAEAIGLTGWDWVNKQSIYVAFDFDAIAGHSDKHKKKLTDQELSEVSTLACSIPWVTVRQSTSGSGLHLYVMLDGITGIQNHTEHAAVGRAILGKMSAITGFDFDSKVDNCGGNIWIWHRKYEAAGGVNGPGLKTIKEGVPLSDIPINWRDHIRVTSGASQRAKPGFVADDAIDWFEELCGQHPKVALDEQHRRLITWLEQRNAMWWFNTDQHMLVAHTYDLQQAHEELGMRGIFKTLAQGSELGADQNCFCFPKRRGVWVVRRHTQGVQEAESWDQDGTGYTRCYLNQEPDLAISARTYGGVENDKGAFVFQTAETAVAAAKALGAHVDLPTYIMGRQAKLKSHKDGRLIFEIKRENGDSSDKMKDWVEERGNVWKKIVYIKSEAQAEPEIGNYDDVCRHIVGETGDDLGWTITSDGMWCSEPFQHVKVALGSFGVAPKEVPAVMGNCVVKPWIIVNRPFKPEYEGDRQWNRNAAQLAFPPAPEIDPAKYKTWTHILNHSGCGLNQAIMHNPWCRDNGIIRGGDYLKCWAAAMFQFPLERLPYLFFHGPQGSGKSTFWKAMAMLMTKGVVMADSALISQSGFNGELENAVLCVVEEVDLRQNKSGAYNRIKDWVTSSILSIHRKGGTPYTIQNSTHWIQCSNDLEYCPVFPDDTRITMCYVPKPETMIYESELQARLRKEAPDFLAALLGMEIPDPCDRLRIPMIATEDKSRAQKLNQTELEQFLEETTYPVQGECIKVSDMHDKFLEWLDADRVSVWSKIKMNRELQRIGDSYVKGRSSTDKGQWYIGNISWTPRSPDSEIKPRLIVKGEMLVSEGTN